MSEMVNRVFSTRLWQVRFYTKSFRGSGHAARPRCARRRQWLSPDDAILIILRCTVEAADQVCFANGLAHKRDCASSHGAVAHMLVRMSRVQDHWYVVAFGMKTRPKLNAANARAFARPRSRTRFDEVAVTLETPPPTRRCGRCSRAIVAALDATPNRIIVIDNRKSQAA
jgi:hypothetical protein